MKILENYRGLRRHHTHKKKKGNKWLVNHMQPNYDFFFLKKLLNLTAKFNYSNALSCKALKIEDARF